MKTNLVTAILMTVVTTVLLGLIYPFVVLALSRVWPDKANGQLITKNGVIVGSRIIAQPFTASQYFHPRPSAAGNNGYDATSSGGTNYGPTNQKLIDRVKGEVAALHAENPAQPIPVDLVTASGSGLDPDITPAAADFQVLRVAKARGVPESQIRDLVRQQTEPRQFGFLGEPRVNVLELNLALDSQYPAHTKEAQR